MDTKELVDKFVQGDMTEDEFNTEVEKLSSEAKEELQKEADKALPNAVEKLKGVRRGIDKIAVKAKNETPPGDSTEEPKGPSDTPDDSISKRLRSENYDAALSTIFTELGIDKQEEQIAFKESFKSVDPGSVNVSNIIKDMKAHYASKHSDEFFKLRERQVLAEKEAEDFNSQGINFNGGSGKEELKKASKEVKDFIAASAKRGIHLTVEQAQRRLELAKKGGHI